MLKKLGKKLKKGIKKAAPLLAIAGLGKAFMNARNQRAQNKMFAFEEGGNLSRPALPFAKRQVEGLNFPVGTDLSGMSELARVGSIDKLKKGGRAGHKKGGRVGVGVAKRGFGRAMKGRK